MAEQQTYLMAIDMLCCHLGLSKEEAKEQLGIEAANDIESKIADTQEALLSLYQ